MSEPKEIITIEGTVKAISPFESHNSFMLKDNDKVWYQVEDVDVSELVKRGYKYKVHFKLVGRDNIVTRIDPLGKGEEEKKEKEDDKDEFDTGVTFEELLTNAHKKFNTDKCKLEITTELTAYDMEKKWAIVHATVKITDSGITRFYQGYGDASQEPGNMKSAMIKPHFIRMAETRAIARALRFATNTASTVEEEKGEDHK